LTVATHHLQQRTLPARRSRPACSGEVIRPTVHTNVTHCCNTTCLTATIVC